MPPTTRDAAGRVADRGRWIAAALVLLAIVASSRLGLLPSVTADDHAPVAGDHHAARAAAVAPQGHPVDRAKRAIADCQARFANVQDYTCKFVKRERIGGKLTTHVMRMKARSSPLSLYFKFQQPNKGREAIYVSGRRGGKLLAHDVGFGRLIAGTMNLDPRGALAMEDCRHPITEAGIGSLIETVAKHWALELTVEESAVLMDRNMTIGSRRCMLIEAAHPDRRPHFVFHKVRLYIDQELGLPIRFEAYDWPHQPGASAELMEEYSYLDLKINVGLSDHDFDPSNKSYSFGRF